MLLKRVRLVLALLIPFIFVACGGSKSDYFITQTGTLNDSKVAGVNYSCGSNSGVTNSKGEFNCRSDSNNIKFYIGSVTLGSIKTSNLKSFTLYPADLVDVNRSDTNSSKVVNILQILQSLDEDNNPYNGITINQVTREALSKIETLNLDNNSTTESDLNAIVAVLGKKLIKAEYAIAHYEDTLRYEINSSVDSVAPAPAIGLKQIVLTNKNSTSTTIYGERGAKIFIDGNYSHINIENNNTANIELNSTGEDGYIYFSIRLKDNLNKIGDEFNLTVLKDTISPKKPTISGVPSSTYNETLYATVHGEDGAIVLINGVKVGTLNSGLLQIDLDVSGEYGEKSFNISLMDLAGNESEVTTIKTIFTRVSLGRGSTYYVPENFYPLSKDLDNNIIILGYLDREIIAGTIASINTSKSLNSEFNTIISSINRISDITINEITRQEYTDNIVVEHSLHSNSSISTVDLISLLSNAIMGNSLSTLPKSKSSSIIDTNFNLTIKLVKNSSGVIYIFLSVIPTNISLEYQNSVSSVTNSQNIVQTNTTKSKSSDSFIVGKSGNNNMAEFLFVVDDSGSMKNYQNAVSQASQDFANAITNAGIDFKIAIITTSCGIDSYESYCYDYKSASRVLNSVGIIENDIELFKEKVVVGTRGSKYETGIYNAERTLQSIALNDSRDGILTKLGMPSNQELSIVILSDETSQYSTRAGSSFNINHNLFLERGYKIYSIINPDVSSISQYDDLAKKTGGLIADITNTSSYSTIMNTIAQSAVSTTGYKLTKSNIIETTISITINDKEIPHGNTNNGWKYIESYNSIIFYGTAIPNEGDKIDINYSYTK